MAPVHDFQADIDAIARIDAVPTILDVVCRTTGMGFAAVARVTEDRWIICGVRDSIDFGLQPGGELKVETTICHEIRQSHKLVVIDDVAEDAVYCGHPTPAMYGFRSYISVPIIRRDGHFFGTLCAIDPRPARLKNPETVGMFTLFAELIAAQLDAGEKLASARSDLVKERSLAELREQFVAVLGHDLRNPVAAIDSGISQLMRMEPEPRGSKILSLMRDSVARVTGLVDNVLDFARARLGDGIPLNLDPNAPLEATLRHVVAEAASVNPDRIIEATIDIDRPVTADTARLAQLVSNLLGNALTHGDRSQPVSVGAATRDGQFRVWVVNAGSAIPAEIAGSIFKPFIRGVDRNNAPGLGLGLYIASEIARAHGGTLTVTSDNAATRFLFEMPATG